MRRLFLFLFLVCAGFAAGAMFAATARAAVCDCSPLPTVPDALAHSYAVFSGTVIGALEVGPAATPAVLVRPLERWTGHLQSDPIPVVMTPGCAYPFVFGETYLIYADGAMDIGVTPNFVPTVSQCTRTALLAGNPDLPLLGPSVLPVPARTRTWGTLKSLYR